MRARISTYIRENAIGCVALFFALGGGVAWATHPGGANTIDSADIIAGEVRKPDIAAQAIGTDHINDGAVRTGDIRDGGVRGVDVLDEALTGSDIDESSLGPVASAEDADTVDGLDAECPAGTILYLGACWEEERRPGTDTLTNAMSVCGGAGRYLPHALESREFAFDFRGTSDQDVDEWTQSAFSSDLGPPADFLGMYVTRRGGIGFDDYRNLHPYRCVAPLVG